MKIMRDKFRRIKLFTSKDLKDENIEGKIIYFYSGKTRGKPGNYSSISLISMEIISMSIIMSNIIEHLNLY